jgi:hypothetical protein
MFFALSMIACKSDSSQSEASEAASKKYTLTPFSKSASFSNAKIEEMTYKEGLFDFQIQDGPYKLGLQTPDAPAKMCANSKKGQHIHLIIDNEPYAAKYTSNFEYDIPDGDHYLLAFLSRSYHESIKSPGAFTARKISVKDKSIEGNESVTSPMLFYSRPKGTYTGKDTKKVMLDFYTANLTLGEGKYKVLAKINGEEHLLDKWQPYYIEGMEMGDNTIELSLLDNTGKLADVPLNPVSRTFKLVADPVK